MEICKPVVLVILVLNFSLHLNCKKSWLSKSMRRLTKPEADMKVYVFPCSVNLEEEKFLNTTMSSNKNHLHNCKRKLVIKMTVNSGGEFCTKYDGFIPIDHVIDGVNGRKKRLLNPLTLRIKREKMYQFYNLQLVKSINAEATEEVINYENTSNFTGCDTSSSHPTCGFSFYNSKMIQYSEGFCCSCDQAKNDQRQPCEGRLGDEKNSVQQEQYLHNKHQENKRSRASRDLDSKTSEEKALDSNNNKMEDEIAFEVFNHGELKKKDDVSFVKQLEEPILLKEIVNSLPESSLELSGGIENVRKSFCGGGFTLDPNITVRSFQFEHTHAPSDTFFTVKHLDFAVKTKSKSDSNSNPSTEENIPGAFKMLMMNNKKVNKIDEKLHNPEATSTMIIPSVNCLNDQSVQNNIPEVNAQQILKLFSSKLEDDKNEANVQKSPSNANGVDSANKMILTTSSVRNNCDTTTACSKEKSSTCMTTESTACTESRDVENIKVMEKVIQRLLPLIHSPNAIINYESIGNVESSTKNSGNSCIVSCKHDSDKSPSVSFSLSNVKVSNASKNLPDYSVLKQSIKEEKVNILQNSIEHEPINRDAMIKMTRKEIKKREATDKQIRGGQSCCQKNAKMPCNADPETYFESAHCLRFSDMWYNVHKLANPKMENTVTIKIYAKHKTMDRRICWENLTKRLSGKVGTSNPVLVDDSKNLLITYSSDDKVAFSLDCTNDFLLVPQPLPKKCSSSELSQVSGGGPKEYVVLKENDITFDGALRSVTRREGLTQLSLVNRTGGPKEYLVLKENDITFDGEECDKAGVTYATFARQSHRCQRETGSCLKNQPLHFWREDKKAESDGKQGQYFLSNFVTVMDQAILQNTTSNQVVLKAPYYKSYQSHIVVEMNADHIEIISDKSEGQISEIYIDATSDKVTIVKAVVTNLGIAAELFGVEFANCSSPLGPSDFDRPGKDEIPPQHRITYTATISSPNLKKETTCTMALLNVDQEVVASRQIVIARGERCVCVWHCRCVCVDHPRPGLPCSPLSLEEYHRAGFPGHLPVLTYAECGLLFSVVQGARWFFFILLLLGVLKAILGLCFLPIRVYGLWFICSSAARSLEFYMEPALACFPVIRDCDAFAIHPRTHKRTVRFLPFFWEFFCNCVFFVCAFRIWICRMCCSHRWCSQGFDDDFGYKQFPQKGFYSPGYSGRYGNGSPCGSPCSSRRRNIRLAAGGESQIFEPDALAAKRDDELAQKRVEELIRAYHVFRNFSRPVGGVQSVPGIPYCIQGYFLESENGVYEFSPSSPLMQIWQMDGSLLEPPKLLDPAPFHSTYRNAREVLEARELSPWARGVVINVL